MSNIKLISISTFIIVVLAGIPHFLETNTINVSNYKEKEVVKEETTIKVSKHPLEGKWKVNYKEEGSVMYQLKMEHNKLVGCSIKLMDVKGQFTSDHTKIFTLTSFINNKGNGIYSVAYENKIYDIPCELDLKSSELYVSYDYYGYKDTEIWKRQ